MMFDKLNWDQAWLAVPGGIALGVAILARAELWNAYVELFCILTRFAIDWIIEPLRRRLGVMADHFERWIMRFCLYTPLQKLGLMRHTTFRMFCTVIYACVALLFVFLLVQRIPTGILAVFVTDGRLRRSWVLLGGSTAVAATSCASVTLWQRNRQAESYVVAALAVVLCAAVVQAYIAYPNTGDLLDLGFNMSAWHEFAEQRRVERQIAHDRWLDATFPTRR